MQGDLVLLGTQTPPDPDSHGIVVTLTPSQGTAGLRTSTTYTVQLTNTGSADDTFSLADALPPDVTGTFSQDTVDVPPGVSNFRDVTLNVMPSFGIRTGDLQLHRDGDIDNRSIGFVLGHGLDQRVDEQRVLKPEPVHAAPGSGLQLTVQSFSQDTETFDLCLAGPAAVVFDARVGQGNAGPRRLANSPNQHRCRELRRRRPTRASMPPPPQRLIRRWKQRPLPI